jgi:hypothetical protein
MDTRLPGGESACATWQMGIRRQAATSETKTTPRLGRQFMQALHMAGMLEFGNIRHLMPALWINRRNVL